MIAQNALGSAYYYGKGVPQDYTTALRWYHKAAEQGDAESQYDLAYMYGHGRGTEQNNAEALRWYLRSADQGNKEAMQVLSPHLTFFRKVLLIFQLLASVFFLVIAIKEGAFFRNITAAAGVIGLLSVSVSWYGYTHYMIRGLACGLSAFSAFNVFRWSLDLLFLVLLVYLVRSGKHRGRYSLAH